MSQKKIEENLPPHNLDAEMTVLGSLLVGDSHTWDEIHGILNENDFYKSAHGIIFTTAQSLEEKGEPIDAMTMSNALEKKGLLEKAGGASYLAELMSYTPSSVNVGSCCRIIKEKSLLRAVIQQSRDFMRRAQAQEYEDIDVFLDEMEADVFKLFQQQTGQGLFPINQLVKQGLDYLESLHGKKLNITGLSTSFEELNQMTSGFQPGELIIIAARPSMGKTALSLNMALQSALEGKRVAFFSVEMAKEQLLIRLLSSLTHIPLSSLKVGNIEKDWDHLYAGSVRLSETALFIDDSSHISPFEIRSKARRLKAQGGLDFIIVDYIQLMSMKKTFDSREREVSEMSRLLKSIAKELKVPVLALSQLNRGVENRTNRRPLLSDLRESGSIEQDADVILMLYRDEYYNPNTTHKGKTEVIISKQRNGPTGTIVLKWFPEYGLFENNIVMDASPLPEHPSV